MAERFGDAAFESLLTRETAYLGPTPEEVEPASSTEPPQPSPCCTIDARRSVRVFFALAPFLPAPSAPLPRALALAGLESPRVDDRAVRDERDGRVKRNSLTVTNTSLELPPKWMRFGGADELLLKCPNPAAVPNTDDNEDEKADAC